MSDIFTAVTEINAPTLRRYASYTFDTFDAKHPEGYKAAKYILKRTFRQFKKPQYDPRVHENVS